MFGGAGCQQPPPCRFHSVSAVPLICLYVLTLIMHVPLPQCLVGFTPFYSEEPVITCKKILRWEQFLDIPEEVAASLSSECLDFMLSLLTHSHER
jgi:hypothetical protein